MAKTIDQQFVEYIAETIVGNPDDVKVDRTIDEKGVLLELYVNPDDLGRVIGRRGVTAQSMRTLLRALGTKNDARYNLKIIDTAELDEYESASESEEKGDEEAPEEESAQEEVSDEEQTEETQEEDEDEGEEDELVSKQRQDIEDLKDELDI